MENQFLNLTKEDLDREHLCCIIRSKKPHPGVEAKRAWLRGAAPGRSCVPQAGHQGCGGVYRVRSTGDCLGTGRE